MPHLSVIKGAFILKGFKGTKSRLQSLKSEQRRKKKILWSTAPLFNYLTFVGCKWNAESTLCWSKRSIVYIFLLSVWIVSEVFWFSAVSWCTITSLGSSISSFWAFTLKAVLKTEGSRKVNTELSESHLKKEKKKHILFLASGLVRSA